MLQIFCTTKMISLFLFKEILFKGIKKAFKRILFKGIKTTCHKHQKEAAFEVFYSLPVRIEKWNMCLAEKFVEIYRGMGGQRDKILDSLLLWPG